MTAAGRRTGQVSSVTCKRREELKGGWYRVSCRKEAVGALPEIARRMEGQIRESSAHSGHNHEQKRAPNPPGVTLLEHIHLPHCSQQVGDVLQDGDHGHLHVAEAEEGGDEHSDKNEVHWRPHANQLPAQRLHLDEAQAREEQHDSHRYQILQRQPDQSRQHSCRVRAGRGNAAPLHRPKADRSYTMFSLPSNSFSTAPFVRSCLALNVNEF